MCSHRGCGQVPSAFPTQLWEWSSALLCSSLAVPAQAPTQLWQLLGISVLPHGTRLPHSFCGSSPKHINPVATWFDSQPAEETLEAE